MAEKKHNPKEIPMNKIAYTIAELTIWYADYEQTEPTYHNHKILDGLFDTEEEAVLHLKSMGYKKTNGAWINPTDKDHHDACFVTREYILTPTRRYQ